MGLRLPLSIAPKVHEEEGFNSQFFWLINLIHIVVQNFCSLWQGYLASSFSWQPSTCLLLSFISLFGIGEAIGVRFFPSLQKIIFSLIGINVKHSGKGNLFIGVNIFEYFVEYLYLSLYFYLLITIARGWCIICYTIPRDEHQKILCAKPFLLTYFCFFPFWWLTDCLLA